MRRSKIEMDGEALRILRAMSPAQKLKAAARLSQSAQQLKAAALRATHPEWTAEMVRRAVREAFLHSRS